MLPPPKIEVSTPQVQPRPNVEVLPVNDVPAPEEAPAPSGPRPKVMVVDDQAFNV